MPRAAAFAGRRPHQLEYGSYAIGSPRLLGLSDTAVDRIPFGSPQDMEELYSEEKPLLFASCALRDCL